MTSTQYACATCQNETMLKEFPNMEALKWLEDDPVTNLDHKLSQEHLHMACLFHLPE